MKKLMTSALLASLAVQAASAQTFPSVAAPQYIPPHAKVRSQLDAMTPHAASAPAASDADPVAAPQADGRYLPPAASAKTRSNREKRVRLRLAQPIHGEASAVSADPYRYEAWGADTVYDADPQESRPDRMR
jgi:hypothetical protein